MVSQTRLRRFVARYASHVLNHYPVWSIHPPGDRNPTSLAKVGGLPIGFPAERWPSCVECGQPMSFLAQFGAGPQLPRIPADHSLYIFKCDGEDVCSFWDPDTGRNACFLIGQPTDQITPAPKNTPVLTELWVTHWRSDDDGLSPDLEPKFYSSDFFDLPDHVGYPHDFNPESNTKAGGLPYWTGNGPAPGLPEGSRVVLQLDYLLQVTDSPEELEAHAADSDQIEDDWVGIANFCSDGIGYVADTQPEAPEPQFVFLIMR